MREIGGQLIEGQQFFPSNVGSCPLLVGVNLGHWSVDWIFRAEAPTILNDRAHVAAPTPNPKFKKKIGGLGTAEAETRHRPRHSPPPDRSCLGRGAVVGGLCQHGPRHLCTTFFDRTLGYMWISWKTGWDLTFISDFFTDQLNNMRNKPLRHKWVDWFGFPNLYFHYWWAISHGYENEDWSA